MYISHDSPAHFPPHAPSLQQSASRPSGAALQKAELNNGLQPLKLEHQAARQVGPALACRRVTAFIEAGCAELYPGLRKFQVILGHSRVANLLPVAAQWPICPQPFLGTITHVLLGHVGGERLPSVQEQAALCSFLQTLDEGYRSALQAGEHDPFMALAHQQDSDGHSLLYLSVCKGMTGLVEWLLNTQPPCLSAAATFTGENDEKINPLHLAVEKGDGSMVCLLLQKNFDVDVVDRFGQTPLHLATRKGDRGMACLLLEKNASVNFCSKLGRTPLNWAVEKGDVGMASVLVDKGADVNIADSLKLTPLVWAIIYGDAAMVALLVGKGADVKSADHLGRTPLLWAVRGGYQDIARLLQ